MQQVFIYLMAMIVIGFLVLVGYRAIYNIMDKQCEVKEQLFITTLRDRIDATTRYDAVTEVGLDAPCGYERLCLVDASLFRDGDNSVNDNPVKTVTDFDGNQAIFADIIEDQDTNNIYLVHRKGDVVAKTAPVLWDAKLEVPNGIYCLDAQGGKFRFFFKGLGKNGVEVVSS